METCMLKHDLSPKKKNEELIMTKIDSKYSLDIKLSSEYNHPHKSIENDFKIIKNIGKGSYAKVILAMRARNYFAIKMIDKQFIEKMEKLDQVHTERHILSKLSHPNIIKLYETFHNKEKLYYVFEYADKGDLKEYLNIYGTPSYTYSKFIIAEIVNGLEYLHQNDIVHRDLKPENIVINDKFHIKIVRITSLF